MLRGIKKKKKEPEGRDMKRALFIATVSGFLPQFELDKVYMLQEMGYEVHYASNFLHPHYGSDNQWAEGTGVVCHQVDFVRSPFRVWKNQRAYRQLKAVLKAEQFDLVHCHTPMGGVLGRLAAESCRRNGQKGIVVFYTVHGFHFYRGAPWKNWLFYYPVERWLAHYTDVLITINQEDFERAKRFRLRGGKKGLGRVERVNGVGIRIEDYQKTAGLREKKRKELGISKEACVFISVGELTKRKNHQVIVKAFALLSKKMDSVFYLICGEGREERRLRKLVRRYHLKDRIRFLGYRKDIKELLAASDCFLFPSKQEGLPVALMEAKATGLFCICSDIRGNRELAEKEELVERNRSGFYKRKMEEFLAERQTVKEGQNEGRIWKEAERYSMERAVQKMRRIYKEIENLEQS